MIVALICTTGKFILCDRCRVHESVCMGDRVSIRSSYRAAQDSYKTDVSARSFIIFIIDIVEYSEQIRAAKGTVNLSNVIVRITGISVPISFLSHNIFIKANTIAIILTCSKQILCKPVLALLVIKPR